MSSRPPWQRPSQGEEPQQRLRRRPLRPLRLRPRVRPLRHPGTHRRPRAVVHPSLAPADGPGGYYGVAPLPPGGGGSRNGCLIGGIVAAVVLLGGIGACGGLIAAAGDPQPVSPDGGRGGGGDGGGGGRGDAPSEGSLKDVIQEKVGPFTLENVAENPETVKAGAAGLPPARRRLAGQAAGEEGRGRRQRGATLKALCGATSATGLSPRSCAWLGGRHARAEA